MVTAGLRADTADLRSFLDVLAAKLSDALPGRVTVRYESGLFKKDRRVELLQLRLDDAVYQLRWRSGTLEATVNDLPEPLDDWLSRLWRHLQANARATAEGRTALDQLMSGQAPAQPVARNPAEQSLLLSRYRGADLGADSTLIVGPNETAVFIGAGKVLGTLAEGAWPLNGNDAAFLSSVADPQSGQIHCSLYFVTVQERSLAFGGMIDNVADPETGLAVGLRVYGDYLLRVIDPSALVLGVGTQDVETDDQLKAWLRDHLMRVLRTDLVAHVAQDAWPVLGLAAHTDEIEKETIERANAAIAANGLLIDRIGSLTFSMVEQDEAALKRYRLEMQQHRLEGDRPGPGAGATCAACGAANQAGAKFCVNCGKPLAATCSSCGSANPSGSHFCANCGAALE